MIYLALADAVLVLHLAFILFVVLGALVLAINAGIYFRVWRGRPRAGA